EAAGVADQNPALRQHRIDPELIAFEREADGWYLDSADCTDDARLGNPSRQRALHIGGFLDFERNGGDVRGTGAARRHDEPGVWKELADFEGRIGVLEAMGEHDLESTRCEIAHRVFEVGGRPSLNQSGFRPEFLLD